MKNLFLVLTLFLGSGRLLTAEPRPPAKFLGVALLESKLGQRIGRNGRLQLSWFVSGVYTNSDSLGGLLGVWVKDGTDNVFVNGDPNGLNMLLWKVIGRSMANVMAGDCEENESYAFNRQFGEVLLSLCHDRSSENLNRLWHSIVFFDAPDEYREQWVDWVANEGVGLSLQQLLFPVLVNPYLLLNQ